MSYWQERMAKAQEALTAKSIKKVNEQIAKYYSRTMKNTIADFEATYNKVLLAVGNDRQPTPADLYKLDAYWNMQGQLRRELEKLGYKEIALLSRHFEAQYFDIYNSISLPSTKAFSTISKESVQQMISSIWCADGKSWSERIWGSITQLQDTLNDNLIDCVTTGRTTTQLKQALQERFNVGFSQADSIVRTEMAHIQTEAAKQRYTDYGVKYVEVLADADERRCPVCGKLHGTKHPVGGKMPIPAHPRCRCCIVPVID